MADKYNNTLGIILDDQDISNAIDKYIEEAESELVIPSESELVIPSEVRKNLGQTYQK